MSLSKRSLVLIVVIALALGGLGIMTASADDRAPDRVGARQDDGTAWLGVAVTNADDGGAQITDVVAGSPADDAGLLRGDVILAVDDERIASAEALVDVIQSYAPGDEVTLSVSWRDDVREVVVTLSEYPSARPVVIDRIGGVLNFLGLTASLTDDGLLIEELDADSPLIKAGFEEGDLITAINGDPVADLVPGTLLRLLRSGEELVFTVDRDGDELEIEVAVPEGVVGLNWSVIEPDVEFGTGVVSAPPTKLGVRFVSLTPEIADERELPVAEGALIEEVFEDTPAAEAGLEVGDIVTAVDCDAVDEEHTLLDRLYAYEEGDEITLTVQRGGDEIELEAIVGPSAPMMPPMFGSGGWPMEGVGPGMGQGMMMFCFPMYGQGQVPEWGRNLERDWGMWQQFAPGFEGMGPGGRWFGEGGIEIEPAAPDTETGDVPSASGPQA
jgi:S1-C subfamily serine protease